jgi:AcrR family transcriptional regulator
MRRKSERGMATRLRIIRTAADLFHKEGVGATSPDEILEASNAGKGQFYHYFGSKEGLVDELQSYIGAVETGSGPINYEVRSWEDLEHRAAKEISHDEGLSVWNGRQWGDGQGRAHPAGPEPSL